jgi:hypothetical protein
LAWRASRDGDQLVEPAATRGVSGEDSVALVEQDQPWRGRAFGIDRADQQSSPDTISKTLLDSGDLAHLSWGKIRPVQGAIGGHPAPALAAAEQSHPQLIAEAVGPQDLAVPRASAGLTSGGITQHADPGCRRQLDELVDVHFAVLVVGQAWHIFGSDGVDADVAGRQLGCRIHTEPARAVVADCAA